jgi:hypothetical protein
MVTIHGDTNRPMLDPLDTAAAGPCMDSLWSASLQQGSDCSWATSNQSFEGHMFRDAGSWCDSESTPSTPRAFGTQDRNTFSMGSSGCSTPSRQPSAASYSPWEPSSPASTDSSMGYAMGSHTNICGLAASIVVQSQQSYDVKWKAPPPPQLDLAMGAGHLQQLLAHLPLDSRHWRQLEQLLENRDTGILQCIVSNYLQYEHPSKWEARKDCQVVNVAGYLNRNIRQKVHMLRNRPELVTLVLQLQTEHPEIAQHLDGRMLQYLHDHLDAADVAAFAAFAAGALHEHWSVDVASPRVVLHFVVKSYIQSVKERQCCWQKAAEILVSLQHRLQEPQPQHQLFGMGGLGGLGAPMQLSGCC